MWPWFFFLFITWCASQYGILVQLCRDKDFCGARISAVLIGLNGPVAQRHTFFGRLSSIHVASSFHSNISLVSTSQSQRSPQPPTVLGLHSMLLCEIYVAQDRCCTAIKSPFRRPKIFWQNLITTYYHRCNNYCNCLLLLFLIIFCV